MNLFNKNPFYILGLFIDSSEKDIHKNMTKIRRFSEIGKNISFDTDYAFFEDIQRDSSLVSKANNDIGQPINKLLHSLLWYWNTNDFDNIAFENLKSDNRDKAIEIWSKVVKDGDVSLKKLSSLSNLKSIYLALSFSGNKINFDLFKKGIHFLGIFLNHKDLNIYIKNVVGDHFKISNQDLELKFTTYIYKEIEPLLGKKKGVSLDKFISCFKNFSKPSLHFLLSKSTEGPISEIEDQIETATELREETPSKSIDFGNILYKNTKPILKSLKKSMGSSDLNYQLIANKVAMEILQCGIDYFNKISEIRIAIDKDGIKTMELCNYAKEIACHGQSNVRIDESIEFMKNWIKEAPNESTKEGIQAVKEIQDLMNDIVKLLQK